MSAPEPDKSIQYTGPIDPNTPEGQQRLNKLQENVDNKFPRGEVATFQFDAKKSAMYTKIAIISAVIIVSIIVIVLIVYLARSGKISFLQKNQKSKMRTKTKTKNRKRN